MKGYILKFYNDIVVITNNVDEWLKENNKRRIADGNEPETKSTFYIEETELKIY